MIDNKDSIIIGVRLVDFFLAIIFMILDSIEKWMLLIVL